MPTKKRLSRTRKAAVKRRVVRCSSVRKGKCVFKCSAVRNGKCIIRSPPKKRVTNLKERDVRCSSVHKGKCSFKCSAVRNGKCIIRSPPKKRVTNLKERVVKCSSVRKGKCSFKCSYVRNGKCVMRRSRKAAVKTATKRKAVVVKRKTKRKADVTTPVSVQQQQDPVPVQQVLYQNQAYVSSQVQHPAYVSSQVHVPVQVPVQQHSMRPQVQSKRSPREQSQVQQQVLVQSAREQSQVQQPQVQQQVLIQSMRPQVQQQVPILIQPQVRQQVPIQSAREVQQQSARKQPNSDLPGLTYHLMTLSKKLPDDIDCWNKWFDDFDDDNEAKATFTSNILSLIHEDSEADTLCKAAYYIVKDIITNVSVHTGSNLDYVYYAMNAYVKSYIARPSVPVLYTLLIATDPQYIPMKGNRVYTPDHLRDLTMQIARLSDDLAGHPDITDYVVKGILLHGYPVKYYADALRRAVSILRRSRTGTLYDAFVKECTEYPYVREMDIPEHYTKSFINSKIVVTGKCVEALETEFPDIQNIQGVLRGLRKHYYVREDPFALHSCVYTYNLFHKALVEAIRGDISVDVLNRVLNGSTVKRFHPNLLYAIIIVAKSHNSNGDLVKRIIDMYSAINTLSQRVILDANVLSSKRGHSLELSHVIMDALTESNITCITDELVKYNNDITHAKFAEIMKKKTTESKLSEIISHVDPNTDSGLAGVVNRLFGVRPLVIGSLPKPQRTLSPVDVPKKVYGSMSGSRLRDAALRPLSRRPKPETAAIKNTSQVTLPLDNDLDAVLQEPQQPGSQQRPGSQVPQEIPQQYTRSNPPPVPPLPPLPQEIPQQYTRVPPPPLPRDPVPQPPAVGPKPTLPPKLGPKPTRLQQPPLPQDIPQQLHDIPPQSQDIQQQPSPVPIVQQLQPLPKQTKLTYVKLNKVSRRSTDNERIYKVIMKGSNKKNVIVEGTYEDFNSMSNVSNHKYMMDAIEATRYSIASVTGHDVEDYRHGLGERVYHVIWANKGPRLRSKTVLRSQVNAPEYQVRADNSQEDIKKLNAYDASIL